MLTIELNKKFYSIPISWNELTAKQLLQVMDVLFLKGYKPEQLFLKLLQVLTGISTYRFFKTDVEELEEYFYLTAFLLRSDLVFTQNLLPEVVADEEKFYGPESGLNNLRMKEFTLTEDYYSQWFDSEKKNEEALNQMIAILYRPAPEGYNFLKNEAGDFREAFNQGISAYNANKYITHWPKEVKLAISTWYAGCRLAMVADNPEVFGGGGEPSEYGLVSVMLDVAESGVFGPFKEVEEQYVNLVLMQMNQTIAKNKKAEAQLKA